MPAWICRIPPPVGGGWFSLNCNGEMTGTTWVEESGLLDGPVMITNTHSVGTVRDSYIKWRVARAREAGATEEQASGSAGQARTADLDHRAPATGFAVSEMESLPSAAPAVASGSASTSGETAREKTGLLEALGLAFVGGLLLNLMPCVFPVLFLKGLALVRSGNEERRTLRLHGLVYTAGILVSFWALVGALLGLRGAGSTLGWGFQFQSPVFLALMAGLLFFLGLSLAGQFEIGLTDRARV